MTHGCRVGRLMSWDWENMGFFSGEKRVLSGAFYSWLTSSAVLRIYK